MPMARKVVKQVRVQLSARELCAILCALELAELDIASKRDLANAHSVLERALNRACAPVVTVVSKDQAAADRARARRSLALLRARLSRGGSTHAQARKR